MQYRNTLTGRVVERPAEDYWLEASAGWERVVDAPKTRRPKAEPAPEADSETPGTGEDERMDD